jgi:pimeloyl-ACP methyl ester carboxylesterase
MGTASHHFRPQLARWSERYQVIPLHLPGHGTNPRAAADPFFPDALAWVEAQLETQGPGHLVGLSLGASVAIHVALERPDLCQSVVLTGYAPAIPFHLMGLMESQYRMFLEIDRHHPDVAQEFHGLHGDRWRDTLFRVLTQMTYHYPTVHREQFAEWAVPLLVLNGSVKRTSARQRVRWPTGTPSYRPASSQEQATSVERFWAATTERQV